VPEKSQKIEFSEPTLKKNIIFKMKKLISLCLGFAVCIVTVASSFTPSGKTTPTAFIPKNESATAYLQALLQFEPWAESVWKDYPQIPNAGYFGDGASDGNGGIRGTCGIALSYAVLVHALPDAAERKHRIKRIEAALRYAEETHQSGPKAVVALDGKKWGVVKTSPLNERIGWQSSLWAGSMGFAAALVEKEIDPKVVEGCKRVVAAEADWLSRKLPPSGYRFDSKAEENAWQSNIITLAAAWMPNDPRAKKWLETAKLYLVNTYTVPSDSSGPLKKWIKTQTLYPSYAMDNHGFYHPTYQMVAGMSIGDSYLMARIINPKVAKELAPFAENNVEKVWEFLQGIILNTGEPAFPSGLDWSLNSFENVSYLAWLATHFNDSQAQWAQLHVAKQILYRQSVNGDGRFTGASCPNGFYREAVEARRVAIAYLHNETEGFPTSKGTEVKNRVSHYSDAGLIVQRSKNALTTISYGSKTMALVYPLNGKTVGQRFFISPNTSSLIGPTGKTKLKSFKRTASGFSVELNLNSNNGRASSMIIESTPDAVVFLETPTDRSKLPAEGWFLTAIENDSLSGGKRTVLWNENSAVINERSGTSTQPISTGWLNIDNWIGFIAVPKGNFIYQAASNYNRNGAAEDAILFHPDEKNKTRAVIVLPGKNAEITAKVQKSLKWTISETECKLSFIRPDGEKMEIKVPLRK
jgi:hypothetical protein